MPVAMAPLAHGNPRRTPFALNERALDIALDQLNLKQL